ncbi:MAG TPA: hypothetical protein VFM68_00610 [Candidatus Saccharimonadales bacterium]|nr:hypothetical protein [Candidatus Saccharimonadales bacterium]
MFSYLIKHEKTISKIILITALGVFLFSLLSYGFDNFYPNILPRQFVPDSLLSTIDAAFALILIYELFALTLGTRGPFISFIHREFEIISLIVLRDVFKQLDQLSATFNHQLLVELAVVAAGSILLYFFVELLERVSNNLLSGPIKEERLTEKSWLLAVKSLSQLLLIVYFIGIVAYEGIGWLIGVPTLGYGTNFLILVFSGLIIYNILTLFIVLISATTYETLFEHSALVLASSVVLISLPRDPLVSVPMIIGALLFVIATVFLHGYANGNSFGSLARESRNKRRDSESAP